MTINVVLLVNFVNVDVKLTLLHSCFDVVKSVLCVSVLKAPTFFAVETSLSLNVCNVVSHCNSLYHI